MPLKPREVSHVEPPRLSLELLSREVPSDDSRSSDFEPRGLVFRETLTVDMSLGDNRRYKTAFRRPVVRTFPMS